MNEQALRLIKKFDLADEVEQHVAKLVKERCKPTKFTFSGTRRVCSCRDPHIPHSVGCYSTVRYGTLEYYCLGVSGDGLEIVVEWTQPGSPEMPSSARGYYIQGEQP